MRTFSVDDASFVSYIRRVRYTSDNFVLQAMAIYGSMNNASNIQSANQLKLKTTDKSDGPQLVFGSEIDEHDGKYDTFENLSNTPTNKVSPA